MPFRLEISTLDVGQGDSSLIIADDGNGQVRSMLIDGGLSGYGPTVHGYVADRLARAGSDGLDHIVVTHYDADHVGGVLAILLSDNLTAICRCLATAAISAWDAAAASSDAQRTAAAAAAAAAAGWGCYTAGHDFAYLAVKAGAEAAALKLPGSNTLEDNAAAGAQVGLALAGGSYANPKLIRTPQSCGGAAIVAGVSTYHGKDNILPARRQLFAENRILERIRGALNGCFHTGGLYRATEVIDTGASPGIPDNWAYFVGGAVPLWSNDIPLAPGVNRTRTSITPMSLGNEVLWRSGPRSVAAPAGSPAAFLVTGLGYVWGRQTGAPPINSGQRQNDVAIGLAIRFGNFFFFTAGDLPGQGELLVAPRLLGTGFPNPQGGAAFAPATRIAAFKVSHHGAASSTPAAYLQAINAQTAFISCGKNKFGKDSDPHPTQAVVDRLDVAVPRFYLTNCKYTTQHIPASDGEDQLVLVGNRSRVCGDNADVNLQADRARGNAMLTLTEAESTGTNATQQFHVMYWEADDLPNGGGRQIGLRVETHPF
ncbi:MBL fold metallo-hydrolase [Microlunatus ginsengisoli]|uniref:Metallo-beta-lactamase domain-containing protein n=1 Tax=Microlunatus ginsengisoli TaxID=363863 RepID=A0ABP7ASW6_9ACTN